MEQPRLMNVDEFAPHVDDLDPGTLTREQWGARSDVHHHSGESREWDPNYRGDVAVHMGTKEQADFRGGEFEHRLRVPKERVSGMTLTDVGANSLHVAASQRLGVPVRKSIEDSVDDKDRSQRYKLHEGGEVLAEPPTVHEENAFDEGWAFPYVNTGEDVRSEYPGAPTSRSTHSMSLVAPQQTIRTWAQDVDESSERNPPEVRRATGEGPSPGVLHQRQFFGTVGDTSEAHARYNRDNSMVPFGNVYKMPHLPHPATPREPGEEPGSMTALRMDQRNWFRTGKGWEVQSPGLL